jgi:hypothetical protein
MAPHFLWKVRVKRGFAWSIIRVDIRNSRSLALYSVGHETFGNRERDLWHRDSWTFDESYAFSSQTENPDVNVSNQKIQRERGFGSSIT